MRKAHPFRKGSRRSKYDSDTDKLADLRQRILRVLGNKCARCGFSDWRALQVDHVDGFPGENRLRRYELLDDILESIRLGLNKYQCLCANCNQIKKYENNEVPNGKRVLVDLSSKNSCQSSEQLILS